MMKRLSGLESARSIGKPFNFLRCLEVAGVNRSFALFLPKQGTGEITFGGAWGQGLQPKQLRIQP